MGLPMGAAQPVCHIPRYTFLYCPCDTPSYAVLDDDTKSYPGFELLCSVEANVRQPFLASPMQYGIGGRGYKDVKVRRFFFVTSPYLIFSSLSSTSAFLSERRS
jgi:hypothetical protein